MRDPGLYQELRGLRFDPPGAQSTFAHRLAKEQRWTPAFTGRVIEEYRRFLYLAATCDHPVTPSQMIDEAWHLHLVYTRSYWDDLCDQILKRPLHHDPTTGGTAEDDKHARQFQQTLDAYACEFGEWPPKDIWLGKKTARVIAPPRNSWGRRATMVAAAVAVIAFGGGAALSNDDLETIIGLVFGFGVLVGLIYFVAKWANRNRNGGCSGGAGGCGGGCGTSGGGWFGGDGDAGGDSGGSDSGGSGCGGGGCGGGD